MPPFRILPPQRRNEIFASSRVRPCIDNHGRSRSPELAEKAAEQHRIRVCGSEERKRGDESARRLATGEEINVRSMPPNNNLVIRARVLADVLDGGRYLLHAVSRQPGIGKTPRRARRCAKTVVK